MKCYKCNKHLRFWQKRKARLHDDEKIIPNCFEYVFNDIQDGLRDGVNQFFINKWDKLAHKRLSHFQAEMAMIDMKKELGVKNG